ncbi:optineurin isoform X2 [Colias croceus]|uniref:optineurin isoform X2 n=1 Tax=Colias crocea TaxID=72248 RepID=UPI001E281225|nr:optineurin isoform X2 [Colias croceus]
MSIKPENDDDSFIIILGSSPGASMDVKCNGGDAGLNKSNLEDAMKDLPDQANMAFKAQFHLGDSPSPASMMVASTIITDDRSTEELQKRFGELLDENVVLKETLKQNNDSMKEQFSLIASCQEDMVKTHKLHKEKFDETRELVEKLRQENKKLKDDIVRLSQTDILTNGDVKSGASSTVEFVTSPDDDTINKLTAQLELVEKQRRQVIVENEKLTWQKESLEHIVDATSKERDDVKEKLKNIELEFSHYKCGMNDMVKNYKEQVKELNTKLREASKNDTSSSEITKRDEVIKQLNGKITALQTEYKAAQMKILDLENIKLEFAQYKCGINDMVKTYKEQIQELNLRIKDVQKIVFQPVYTTSDGAEKSSQYAGYLTNVQTYNRTLKHLAEHLNNLTSGLSDGLVKTLGAIITAQEFKLERASLEKLRSSLVEVKQHIEKQHSTVVGNIGEVKGTMSIFEAIFKDYNELLKKTVTKQDSPPPSASVEQLTAALVARGEEVQALENEIAMLIGNKEDCDLLKAQVELYRSDFEAERQSREMMASEKEVLATDLRVLQKKHEELTKHLEEVRKVSPSIYSNTKAKAQNGTQSTAKRITFNEQRNATNATSVNTAGTTAGATARATTGATAASGTTEKKTVYKCPKCLHFSSDQYKVMEDHFDYCLDDF